MLPRAELAARIRSLLRLGPVVALLGPRQSGKTTPQAAPQHFLCFLPEPHGHG